jgi:hypothetical protein
MALPARVFRAADLSGRWRQSFCDDSAAGELVRLLGLKVRMVPALTMINREAVDLPGCVRFLRRQLLCARLDLARWPLLLAANVGMCLALAVAAALTGLGLYLGHWSWALWFGGLLAVHLAGMTAALVVGEARIRRIVRARGQADPPTAPFWKEFLASLLALAVHLYVLAAAVCARRVQWRGVDYAVASRQQVRLLSYRPFRPPVRPADPNRSIV